jgi:hypothetical protein
MLNLVETIVKVYFLKDCFLYGSSLFRKEIVVELAIFFVPLIEQIIYFFILAVETLNFSLQLLVLLFELFRLLAERVNFVRIICNDHLKLVLFGH